MLEKLRIRENAVTPTSPRHTLMCKDLARRLLRINSTLTSLERALLLRPAESSLPLDSLYSLDRLARLTSHYAELSHLLTTHPAHPFLRALRPRVDKVRAALTRDCKDAIAAAKQDGNSPQAFTILQLVSKTDLKVLKS